jgi:hypothetical protein
MPKYVIEREIPDAGEMSAEELREASRESNAVRNKLGPKELQWIHSYICDDKIYCVYIAANEDILLEHALCLDIPADRISRVRAVTDPTTGETEPSAGDTTTAE